MEMQAFAKGNGFQSLRENSFQSIFEFAEKMLLEVAL
jgi:hypothetical protein